MMVAAYWKEKTELVENAFEGWQRKEEIQVRKLIISSMMNIPEQHISYYLKRDIWLLKFALGDDAGVDSAFAKEESTKDKVNSILGKYFYRNDFEELCRISGKECPKGTIGRIQVCDCIKELVNKDSYNEFSDGNQIRLSMYEKIYFDALELVNGYVEEMIGTESYCSILVEQWKTANEMAANISAQRNNMNNFFMSLMSILIGGILFSNQLVEMDIVSQTILYLVILVIGAVCCQKWIAQINNYGRLNGAKYDVINELERQLPANVMLYEYMRTEQNSRRNKNKINFSKQEIEIAKLFRFVVIAVPVFLLISTWVDYFVG